MYKEQDASANKRNLCFSAINCVSLFSLLHFTYSMQALKPRRLRHGDLIGLVTPASPIADASRLERGVHYLESLGYRVLPAANVNKMRGYLAGTDEERAADLHALFKHKEVRAIFCIRGGYGTPRLLSLLNYRLIARNPKIFVGYSDVTALQLAFWRRCRLVSFHGPMVGVDFGEEINPFAEEWFWKLVTTSGALGRLPIDGQTAMTLRPGKRRGRLLGGNLSRSPRSSVPALPRILPGPCSFLKTPTKRATGSTGCWYNFVMRRSSARFPQCFWASSPTATHQTQRNRH